MTSQVFTIHTATMSGALYDGSSSALAQTSGLMFLGSSLWSGSVVNQSDALGANVFRIPRGCDLKIWENTLYGSPGKIMMQVCNDGSGSKWNTVKADDHRNMDEELVIKHTGRPIVVPSPDGNVIVRFAFNAIISGNFTTSSGIATDANMYGDYTVEVVESEKY